MMAKSLITHKVMHNRLAHASNEYMRKTQAIVYGFPKEALQDPDHPLEYTCCAEGKGVFRSEPTSDPECPRRLDLYEPREAVSMDTTRVMPLSIQGGDNMYVKVDLGSWFVTGTHTLGKESSTTVNVIAAAVAASTALPPRASIDSPACAASG